MIEILTDLLGVRDAHCVIMEGHDWTVRPTSQVCIVHPAKPGLLSSDENLVSTT
jgi:hypothetical protein